MKRLFIMLVCMAVWNGVYAATEKIDLVFGYIDDLPAAPTVPKAPMRVPSVFRDGYLLTLSASHPEYIINIVQDDEMVFTSVIPAGVTEFELPAYIEGECQIQFVCGRFSFIGFINLK